MKPFKKDTPKSTTKIKKFIHKNKLVKNEYIVII